MKLFRWRSDAIKAYSQGHIFAIGETVEEARAAVRAGINAEVDERWTWLSNDLYTLDPEETEERAARIALFERDIAAEPVEATVFFVTGSE